MDNVPAIPDFQAVGRSAPSGQTMIPRPSGRSPIGEALEGAGQKLQQVADVREKRVNSLALATAKSEFLRQSIDLGLQVKQSPDFNSWRKQYDDGVEKLRAGVGANLTDPDTRAQFDLDAQDHAATISGQFAQDSFKRLQDTQRGGVQQLIQDNGDAILKAPDETTRTGLIQSTSQAIDGAVEQGLITPETAVIQKRKFAQDSAKGYAETLDANPPVTFDEHGAATIGHSARYDALAKGMARDADGVVHFEKTGTWLDFITPDDRSKMIHEAETQDRVLGNATITEHERVRVADERAKKDASDNAAGGLITRLINNPAGVSAKEIANDPNLDWRTKNELNNILRARLKEVQGDDGEGNRDAKTYGSAFIDLYRRVNAPDGDPNKLTDQTQLYPLVGKGLTVSGADKLIAEMQGKRTPEGEAESQMKKQFFDNAKAQISGSDPILHMKDPKGDELYLRFMAQALAAYDAGKKSGKTPAQMLNPESTDYIGKSVGQFKRPMSVWQNDLLGSNAENADTASVPAKVPLPSADKITAEELRGAVRDGRMSRSQGEEIALRRGWIRLAPAKPAATSTSKLPSVPAVTR